MITKILEALMGHPIYSLLQGIQLNLQSGRSQPDGLRMFRYLTARYLYIFATYTCSLPTISPPIHFRYPEFSLSGTIIATQYCCGKSQTGNITYKYHFLHATIKLKYMLSLFTITWHRCSLNKLCHLKFF